jgi:plasmid stabilization system protein ParE
MLAFLSEAADEVEEATVFYENRVTGLGVRFREEFENTCTSIVRDPLLWRKRDGGFRRVNFRGFPYYVAYLMRGDHIYIVAVAHASRHPDYWKRRKF